jgi:hypothetical protein
MSVLVDTSIWVAYFRSGDNSEKLDFLIDENLIVINDLVLAELVPSLKVRNQRKIINLLLKFRTPKRAHSQEQPALKLENRTEILPRF